ncbi:MAG TPA: hypothetical protein P5528_15960 [Steroidobacteraceae bacterium]|nr:hypothetical protein [Steroidobacteraceae bacterium]HRX90935.1 hypothetical protein [Steroidobacteraceae bacterium]
MTTGPAASGPDPVPDLAGIPAPRIEYRTLDPGESLPDDVLCAVTFGTRPSGGYDPRCVRVGLEPLAGGGLIEVWHSSGPVQRGYDGLVRYTCDEHHLAAAVEIDERRYGGIAAAARAAYTAMVNFQKFARFPQVLRVWNYFDAINAGDGDSERYRQFCVGRAAGLGDALAKPYPAATAIGRRDGDCTLQVYWLAGRVPGRAIENPRQVSAYHYPRVYSPSPPVFSRAMLVSPDLLLISGTASVVGHASHHPGDLPAQLEETLRNLRAVIKGAAGIAPALPRELSSSSRLKVYLRDTQEVAHVERMLHEALPAGVPFVVLAADVCRSDLLVEIDCQHGV